MNQVAEGVRTAEVVTRLARNAGIEMPIAWEVDSVINHGATARDAYRGLLKSAPGHEQHGTSW